MKYERWIVKGIPDAGTFNMFEYQWNDKVKFNGEIYNFSGVASGNTLFPLSLLYRKKGVGNIVINFMRRDQFPLLKELNIPYDKEISLDDFIRDYDVLVPKDG